MGKRFERRFWLGRSDRNLAFADLVEYLVRLGFRVRVRGSHHIFSRSGVPEIVNLQPEGSRCKPYQVRQVRRVLRMRGLR